MATTIANLALVASAGGDPAKPVFFDIITLDLKADYDAAGLLLFKTACLAALGAGKTPIAVTPVNARGLKTRYDSVNDTLFFDWSDLNAGADGPDIVVPTGDMAVYTGLKLLVISQ